MKAKPALPILLIVLLAGSLAVAQQSAPKTGAPDASATVPTISADRGDCTASFDVLDDKGKPVYQAAIHALIRWGLAHKTDLTVSTNYYGKAEFTGLPNYTQEADSVRRQVRRQTAHRLLRSGQPVSREIHGGAEVEAIRQPRLAPNITRRPGCPRSAGFS